ncbi:DUF4163 domain-containing protein [Paenibacillus sp. Marseille-Q4541]|uniref:PdaC/SigV domain-containing protein n=1 Tax=Paenibacillus sp. Marseille-Q4541 TaxID=2831522 RepID=UPI001BAC4936|nr:DUF4163 domain-containing protein [Paenibacillus sp. Marseille-Q4541]
MNKQMKRAVAVFAAGALIGNIGMLGGQHAAASEAKPAVQQSAQSGVTLKYNGNVLQLQGKLVDGNTMIPISILRDAAGLPLTYTSKTKTYNVGSGILKLSLEVSDYGINTYINDRYIGDNSSNYEAKNIGGKIYVPFKVLSEYMGFQGDYNASSKSLNLSKRKMNEVQITSETISSQDKNATILIRYPKLSGLSSTDAQEAINKVFKDKASAFAAEAKTKSKKRDGKVEQPYDFNGSFLLTFNREGVLSIVTDNYEYVGGAHGMTLREGFTFSLKDGKQLSINDLLHSSEGAKKKLDKMLKEKTKNDDYTDGFNGLKTNPDFYLKEGGITVFYQQYEIAPYAAGFPTYTFNFNDLLPKGTDPFSSAK